jgi:hypothetical protein
MSGLGMEMVERVAERSKAPEVANDKSADPYKTFANLTRVVRLTLMLETRMDEKILAMCNGKYSAREPAPAAAPARRAPAAAPAPAASPQPAAATGYVAPVLNRDSPFPERNRIRDVVWEAIDREVRDPYDAHWMMDRLHERLIAGDAYDPLIGGDFRGCIAAICADLGLDPDWDHWSDDQGFVRGPNEAFFEWSAGYGYDPETSEVYIRRRAERQGSIAAAEPEPHPRQ